MLFSCAKSRRPGGFKYFYEVNCETALEIERLTTSDVWSAILWRDGVRLTVNFLEAGAAVFDFDSGVWTLGDAHKWFSDRSLKHLIGTTRSHQIEKDGRKVDRFRVVVPFELPITDARAYTQNMKRWLKMMPADQIAHDGGRRWLPFTALTHVAEGSMLSWRPYKAPPPKQPCAYQAAGIIPKWIREILDASPVNGQRNASVFKIAINLAERGFSQGEVIRLIAASRIDLPNKEIENAIQSGFRKKS